MSNFTDQDPHQPLHELQRTALAKALETSSDEMQQLIEFYDAYGHTEQADEYFQLLLAKADSKSTRQSNVALPPSADAHPTSADAPPAGL